MAGLPKRPLNFRRMIDSEDAKIILKEQTIRRWARIFPGWTIVQQPLTPSSPIAANTKSSKSKR